MPGKINKILLWLPRVLTILYILFLALFALDIFSEGYNLIGTIIALLIHLIPNFILLIILLIAWKRQLLGGVLFLILAIIFTVFFKTYQNLISFVILSGSLLLVGGLFVAGGVIKKRESVAKRQPSQYGTSKNTV